VRLRYLFWGSASYSVYFIKVIRITVPRNKSSKYLFYIFFAATCFGSCWPSSGGIHNYTQYLRLESLQNFNVGGGSSSPQLYTIGPDGFEYGFIEQ
jgi:hypothetical protein